MSITLTARRAALLAGAAMLAVYVATLAPSVTFWDAGEFIAAARTLGIPHPPGTPLFILALNSWARAWFVLPFATATNLFSAVCAAAAVALTALWLGRGSSPWTSLAAAITAGAMSSAWQNATETEVYAASLVLSIGAIAAADLSGRTRDTRWTLLAAYLLALSLPLHLSALVAAPVVIYLATERPDGSRDWSAGVALFGISICVLGVSRLSMALVVVGGALALAAPFINLRPPQIARRQRNELAAAFLCAASLLLFMLVRARHDPAINQGNPETLGRLAYVVGREQYELAGVWPRQAPFWLQIANWFEYADWQIALSLAPSVIPTVWRILATVGFAALGGIGARRQRAMNRRAWRAVALLFASGSIGVIAYLNLKVGTSFGWQFVPDQARHEARDRDYFFVLGFWAWGIWAGIGAMVVAERVVARIAAARAAPRRRVLELALGLALAALPIALNWTAVDRRAEPGASLPREVAHELLDPLPQRAVLFVAGDNDSYPLWYVQQVENHRRDVTVVTMPLLGARWYSDELARRFGLAGPEPERVAALARGMGRPVAAALTVLPEDRNRLAVSWTVVGNVALDSYSLGPARQHLRVISVDRAAVRRSAERVDRWRAGKEIRSGTDPVHGYFWELLSCPRMMLDPNPKTAQVASLDSLCNLR